MKTDEAVNPKFEKETPLARIKRQATAFIQEYDQRHDPSAEQNHARQFAGACTTLIASIEHYEKALKIVSDDLFLERARKVFPGISLADALKEAQDRSEFAAGLHLLYPTPFLDIVRDTMYKEKNDTREVPKNS